MTVAEHNDHSHDHSSSSDSPDHGHGDHGHGSHGHGHGALGHIVPPRILLAVFGTLVVLTVVTVFTATQIHLPGNGNLVLAMIIATIKATLVCLYFMHLRWDKPMHAVVFLTGLLFFILFAGICLMDSSQYQRQIRWDQNVSNIF
jgi:cytochrome c oxidase subunit 4